MSEHEKAMAELRRAVAETPMLPRGRFEFALLTAVCVVGLIIAIASGLGAWSLAYAPLLGSVWVMLRATIIYVARG